MRRGTDFLLTASFLGILLFAAGCSSSGTKQDPTQTGLVSQVAATKWEGYLVRRPGSEVEDQKVYFVKEGRRHWVPSGDWLKLHGFKFPEDVHFVPTEELAKIPEGEAVQ